MIIELSYSESEDLFDWFKIPKELDYDEISLTFEFDYVYDLCNEEQFYGEEEIEISNIKIVRDDFFRVFDYLKGRKAISKIVEFEKFINKNKDYLEEDSRVRNAITNDYSDGYYIDDVWFL
jgi:hypothetical protein